MFITIYYKRIFIYLLLWTFIYAFTFLKQTLARCRHLKCPLLWQFSLLWLDPNSEKNPFSRALVSTSRGKYQSAEAERSLLTTMVLKWRTFSGVTHLL